MLQRLLLALLTPAMLWLAWPGMDLTPFLFVAFIPMLWLERTLPEGRSGAWRWFFYSWLAFGLWNLLSTWWLINAHWSGVLMTTLVNGGLMALAMSVFRFIKDKLGNQRGYLSLPFLWISLEMFHRDWDLSFPWLNFGNGFASRVEWIQWYEHVGAMGGTLWIWIINLLLFRTILGAIENRRLRVFRWSGTWVILLGVILPISWSTLRYLNYEETGIELKATLIQPNIDTYGEKNSLTNLEQLTRFVRLANLELDSTTDFLLGPEDLLPKGIYQSNLAQSSEVKILETLTTQYPKLNILLGASTFRYYQEPDQSPTARPFPESEGYYDVYNSALFLNSEAAPELYHKSKRVAGVEMMPFGHLLKPLIGELVREMGGTTGGLGTQEVRTVFTDPTGAYKAAPVICWESDFGQYVGSYVRNGANFIALITNDDWWGNTPGHIHHLHYARLRAIENRRSVARSANTGISCFINQRGDLISPTSYKEEVAITASIRANDQLTYYSKSGDVVGRVALFITLFLLLFSVVRGFLRRVDSRV